MNRHKKSLDRLVRGARRAYQLPRTEPAEDAPLGFAARVVAQSGHSRSSTPWADLLERCGWWGVGASVAVCLVTFAARTALPEASPFDPFLESEFAQLQTN